MSNKPTRGKKMEEQFIFRCTIEDKLNIELAAANEGMSSSALIRNLLIKARVLDPVCF